MPNPRRNTKSGGRRKVKKSSDSGLAIVLGVIGTALLVGVGIVFMLPKNGMKAIQDGVSTVVPLSARKPATHDDHLQVVLNAEREYAQVMSSLKDKVSTEKALPQIKRTSGKVAEVTQQWLEFIKQNPLSPDDSARLFVERSNGLNNIRKEFPYDLAFQSNVDIMVIFDQVATERRASNSASKELTQALNSSSRLGQQLPFAQPTNPGGQPLPGYGPLNTAGNSPASVTGNSTPDSPSEPPETVPAPRTPVHEKYGSKAVAIRLHGVTNPGDADTFMQRLTILLGPGKFEVTTTTAEGAYFAVVGPIDDIEPFLTRLEMIGRVRKYDGKDDSNKLAFLIVNNMNRPGASPFPPPRIPGKNP